MKKKTRKRPPPVSMKWIAGALAITVVIGYLVLMLDTNSAAKPSGAAPGDRSTAANAAPAFTLTDLQGQAVSLSDFRGKVVILDFWATWCPPCKREIPDFVKLQDEYALRGLQIVGVGLDDREDIRRFARAQGINYPVLFADDDVASLYGGIPGIPTTFVIDKQGRIVKRFEGFTERAVFEREITPLL